MKLTVLKSLCLMFILVFCQNVSSQVSQQNRLKLPYFEDFKSAFPVRDNDLNETDLLIKRIGREVSGYYERTTNRNSCALRVSVGLNKAGLKLPFHKHTFLGKDGNQYFLNAKHMLDWMLSNFTPTKKFILTNDMRDNGNALNQIENLQGIYMMIPVDANSFGASGHADIFYKMKINQNEFRWGCDGGCYENEAQEVYFWELPKKPTTPRTDRSRNGRIG